MAAWEDNHPAILAHAQGLGYKRATGVSYPPVWSDDAGYRGVWTSWADAFNSWKAAELAKDIPWWESNPGGDTPDDDDDDDGDPPGPKFPSTGPVFTPLDPAGIAQRNYSKYYPEYTAAPTVRAASAYPTMGLLSDPYGGADVDLYQPWSAKYGANVAPSSLWNYQPPSGLDVGPGPKVGFVK
jgi:hypothetical protein